MLRDPHTFRKCGRPTPAGADLHVLAGLQSESLNIDGLISMSSAQPRATCTISSLFLMLAVISLIGTGCGSGGGGGGGTSGSGSNGNGSGQGVPDPAKDFFLTGASFARPTFDVTGNLVGVVNPSSLFEVDPITNVPLPGFPKVLVPGTSLASLASLNFEQILDPLTPQIPLLPRNAAMVLQFSQPINAQSLMLSDLDPAAPGLVTAASTVQIRHKDGSIIETRAFVQGSRIILLGVVGDSVGFEASPLVFNSFGNAVEDPTGHLRVVLGVGVGQLHSTGGLALIPRADKLGTVEVPLPFNPGNSSLDAIVLQTETGVVTFNGFLPDLTAPRLIRPIEALDIIDAIGLTSVDGKPVIEITGAPLVPAANVLANGGLGEWASARMDVTGLGGVVSSYVVLRNYSQALPAGKPVFQLVAGSMLDPSVAVGSSFKITRSEFFEPIPPPLPSNPLQLEKVTVDPLNHPRDPLDPQDLLNHDLRYFVRMFDEDGVERTDRWNPATGLFLAVPPKSQLQFAFSEPMDLSSFRPYESFYVTDLSQPKTATAFQVQRIGQSRASSDNRSIRFAPFLENQSAPEASDFIGFGGTPSSLKLVLRTIPEQSQIAALKANASPGQLALLQDLGVKGVLGIYDLGGRGLGLPQALLDQGNTTQFLLQSTSVARGPFPPAVDFEVAFQTLQTSDPDYGVVVHRFMGQASTSSFNYPNGSIHDTVTSGVEYADFPPADVNGDSIIERRFIYGPQIFDIALNLPGKLSGASAQTIQHLIDDFNKPKASAYSSPNGEDVLNKLGFGTSTPLNSPFGCRFQHIYRAGDASPAYNDFNGVILDLVGLAWSPLNNTVSNTVISEMEILVGLSGAGKGRGPSTAQGNGIPDTPQSGLIQQFDCNLLEWAENCCLTNQFPDGLTEFIGDEPPLTTVVASGTPYPIIAGSLFKPQNAGATGTFNYWLNYPAFNAGIDPTFGQSTTLSFPYDSRFPMLIEYRLDPAISTKPSVNNFYRFSPGILSSALPRFRIWSQGQDPLANCVPNFGLGSQSPGGIACAFRAGEGGPLLEPGTFFSDILPPVPNNGMPIIKASTYQLPPQANCVEAQLPKIDAKDGTIPQMGPPTLPKCNTDPNTNWYYANGQLAYPLPNVGCFPGPQSPGQKTAYVGYGTDGICIPALNVNEPNYQCNPGRYGDNSRYFMLWQYRKRVSIIESPTVQVYSPSGLVEYQAPIIDPPLALTDPNAGLIIEVRAGTDIDFPVPVLESGYVSVSDPDFVSKVSGDNVDRLFVKFRASFAVAPNLFQPPFIDTVVIPYRKVLP